MNVKTSKGSFRIFVCSTVDVICYLAEMGTPPISDPEVGNTRPAIKIHSTNRDFQIV
jgi:hypothetical protein